MSLTSPVGVFAPEEWWRDVTMFGDDIEAATGWVVQAATPETAAIVITADPALGRDGFQLAIEERVHITAGDGPGLSYALTALRQLGPSSLWSKGASLDAWTLPRLTITDSPSFAWRGSHLDVARHFFPVETVLRHIDLIALHRLNVLHLHLNDDQGWRVEIPAWPALTSVGAWRTSSPLGHESEGRQDSQAHGGFYGALDIARIREHAARRHVTIVPEIDLPGHAQAVLAAYPHFGNTTEPVDVWTHWGISTRILNVEPATLEFADDVVRYVAGLFPGSPVHIGGDECPTDEWQVSPAAQAVMREHGFTHAQQLQGLYTTRLAAGLRRDGHDVIAWDEVLDADVPPDTIIAAWRSEEKGLEATARGLRTIMCPNEFFYLDWLSSFDPDEPVAVGAIPDVTTWEKLYGHPIIPAAMPTAERHLVIGSQVQLWTEYITTQDRLDYMAYPRLSAFSEVVWGTATDVVDVRPRLVAQLERLAAAGVQFRPLDPPVA